MSKTEYELVYPKRTIYQMPLKPPVLMQKRGGLQKGDLKISPTSLKIPVSDSQDACPHVLCSSCKSHVDHVEYSDEFRKSTLKKPSPIIQQNDQKNENPQTQVFQLNQSIRKYPACTFDVNTREKIGKLFKM